MGSKKNKNNNYRHVYARRKPPQDYNNMRRKINKSLSKISVQGLHGSRIINIDKLKDYISVITQHSARCRGQVTLIGEKRDGLASILNSKCDKCDHEISFSTSRKVPGPRGMNRWESNLAAVWGQMATGGGHATLSNTMSVLGIPVMAKGSFSPTETDIGEWWRDKLTESMVEAGKEEKRMAEEMGNFHHGVPAITVIVDGGWSKRAHKHSYNAKSGVGIIIGKNTGKLLYIGVKNKYCTACTQGVPKEKHLCYKNWSESSSEMETEIILEGFLAAESTHGVRYTSFIGDGDSSVYPTLLSRVPVWGRDIRKYECANHCCKCYRSSLEKLAAENAQYRGRGGLTQKMRKRLTSAARCAIKMRSQESNKAQAIKSLEKDIINGPLHCFGYHSKCSADFCRTVQENQQNQPISSIDSSEVNDCDEENLSEQVASKYTCIIIITTIMIIIIN